MQINAFSAPPAPSSTHGVLPATAPATHSSPSFAHFLSRQTDQAVKPQSDSPAAAAAVKSKAAAKVPAPAATPQPTAHKTEAASGKDKPADAERTDSAPTASDAAATTAVANASSTPTDPAPQTPAADGLNPWMALMQQLAAAQPAAPAATGAEGTLPPADGAAAASPGDAADALPTPKTGGQGASATPAAALPAADAASLATRLAAKPEGGASHFGNALAASLAAQPESSAIGSEWRARERDAASTALPTASASATNFAGLLASAPTPSQAPAATAAASSVNLPVPLDSPEFAPSLAATVSVLAREGVQEARINLHPAEMGPITVQIAVDGTQARVDFSADMAATRSALEAGLPELASALRDAGLTLSGGGVFDQSRSGHQGTGSEAEGGRRSRSAAREGDGLGAVAAAQPAARRVTLSGLDEYA